MESHVSLLSARAKKVGPANIIIRDSDLQKNWGRGGTKDQPTVSTKRKKKQKMAHKKKENHRTLPQMTQTQTWG